MKWHIPIPYFPLLNSFTPNQGGGGAWALVPLSYASSAAGICQPIGSKRGSEATEWGESGGCVSPSHGRDIF